MSDRRQLETVSPEVAVAGVGLWLPGYPSFVAWCASAPDPHVQEPKGDALGRIYRRRAGPLGRALSDAACEALRAAGVDPGTVPSVLGSSLGEASTLIRLLEQMWRGPEPMSPADFTLSVHNAASGVMSIAAGNRGFTTSIGADHDTPASALLEGIGLVATEGLPVLVACGDEASPSALSHGPEGWGAMAAAVVLTPCEHPNARAARLQILGPAKTSATFGPLPASIANNPQAGLIELLVAIARGGEHVVRLDRGAGRGFRARVRSESRG